jgi:hypothetical protein
MNNSMFFAVSGVAVGGWVELWVVNKSGRGRETTHDTNRTNEGREMKPRMKPSAAERQPNTSHAETRSRGETMFNDEGHEDHQEVQRGWPSARTVCALLAGLLWKGTTKLGKSCAPVTREATGASGQIITYGLYIGARERRFIGRLAVCNQGSALEL